MLEKLIEEGEKLKSQVKEVMGRKIISGVEFETWVSKSVLYLERNHEVSSLTEKALVATKGMNLNNSGAVFEFLLGTIKAFKEYEEFEEQ